jgi:tripartite-type tricarboxylate transporter receptor subunit TctC
MRTLFQNTRRRMCALATSCRPQKPPTAPSICGAEDRRARHTKVEKQFGETIMRRWHFAIGLVLCLSVGATNARAEYPDRPITLIVPFAAGGANDSIARLLANKLATILGQTVIVENRPGGGTVIGSSAVARSKADGYTILLVSAAHAINPYILKNIPYDTLRDFTPISQLTRTAYILVTSRASKFDRIEDLVTTGKSPNGQIRFASSGTGSAPHLAGRLFATLSGANAAHIPYQGGAPALIGLLRGDVDMFFSSLTGARSFIESKQVRALGVSSDKRLAMLADVPTISEQGVRGFAIDGWYGVVGPANLPTDVTATLNAGILMALADPDLVSRLKAEGEEVVGSNPEAFDALLRSELTKYKAIVATAGLKPH